MKTIGLLGGMSWESTVTYYQIINRRVAAVLGGLHSAEIVVYSVDFAPIEALQRSGDWTQAAQMLCAAARSLQQAGAGLIVLCTNTMHRVAPQIEASVGIPLLHIADPTGEAIRAAGHRRVGLLGTRFTMEEDFYRRRLEEKYGLEVVVPGEASRTLVDNVIYSELCRGVVSASSRSRFSDVVAELSDEGAEAAILGCTEIGLLLRPSDAALPLFDTTLLHGEAAAGLALGVRPL